MKGRSRLLCAYYTDDLKQLAPANCCCTILAAHSPLDLTPSFS